MKSFIIICSILLISTFNLFAHGPYKNGNQEEIEKMKVAYITDKLDLSVEEAQAFWPVYNAYQKDRKALREEYRSATKEKDFDINSLSEAELKAFVDSKLDYDKAKLAAKEKYHKSLESILSTKKIALLYTSEHDFRKKLFKEMKERSENCPGSKGEK